MSLVVRSDVSDDNSDLSDDNSVPTSAQWGDSGVATAQLAAHWRRTLGAWLVGRHLAFIAHDVVLAVYETMANSVEHAYRDTPSPGPLTITVVDDGDALTVTVADTGTWTPHTPTPHRGRGLELARAVTDHVSIDTGSGTTTTLTWHLDTLNR